MANSTPLAVEEVRIQRLATAVDFFENGDFSKATEVLESIDMDTMKEKTDFRLQHNLVISRFCAGGAREPGALLESLKAVAGQSGAALEEAQREEAAEKARLVALAAKGGEGTADASGASGMGASIDSPDTSRKAKELGKESQVSLADARDLLLGDKTTLVSDSLVQYNIALAEFSLKQHASALERLELVFERVHDLPDYLACNLCFLLLDAHLALAQQQPEHQYHFLQRTGDILAHLDKAFPSLLTKISSKRGAKEAGGTITLPTGRKAVDPVSFKYLLHLYRAKVLLCSESTKQAKREIKWCMSVGNQNPTSLFLKSNLEYQGKNYTKSIKLLNAFQGTDLDSSLPALYYNNLGCIHFGMGKERAAEHYFFRALVENERIYRGAGSDPSLGSAIKKSKESATATRAEGTRAFEGGERDVNLHSFAKDRRTAILYNNGLMQLLSGNAELAFECFLGASPDYHRNPWLWLRIAECCIANHFESVKKESKDENTVLVGEGDHKVVLLVNEPAYMASLAPDDSQNRQENTDSIFRERLGLKGNPFGVMSLSYAEICLATCLRLLDESASTTETPITGRRNTLRLCALTKLSYVSLACGSPHKALAWAARVLALEQSIDCSFVALVYMYSAEANCLLNRKDAAMVNLELLLKDDPKAVATTFGMGTRDKAPKDCFRYALLHNLAVTCAMTGDVERARSHLTSAVLVCPTDSFHKYLRLQAYLQLMSGDTSAALSLLQTGRASLGSSDI